MANAKETYVATVQILIELDAEQSADGAIPDALNAILTEQMRKYAGDNSCLIDWRFAQLGGDVDTIAPVTIPADYEPDYSPFPHVNAVIVDSQLFAALKAVVARINGVFDAPELVAYGPLGNTTDDVLRIARDAIEKASNGEMQYPAYISVLEALEKMRKAYGRLHDFLSDAIESGRLAESDIPDDYAAIVEQLETCAAADDAARLAIEAANAKVNANQARALAGARR